MKKKSPTFIIDDVIEVYKNTKDKKTKFLIQFLCLTGVKIDEALSIMDVDISNDEPKEKVEIKKDRSEEAQILIRGDLDSCRIIYYPRMKIIRIKKLFKSKEHLFAGRQAGKALTSAAFHEQLQKVLVLLNSPNSKQLIQRHGRIIKISSNDFRHFFAIYQYFYCKRSMRDISRYMGFSRTQKVKEILNTDNWPVWAIDATNAMIHIRNKIRKNHLYFRKIFPTIFPAAPHDPKSVIRFKLKKDQILKFKESELFDYVSKTISALSKKKFFSDD